MPEQTNFTIPRDGYLSFDALNFKQFIIDRLNETGVFTDQNFEGPYINTIIEILGYFSHTLLYYLNQTSTESMFSESQIYENINRIVKLIDYKPIGRQASILNFVMTANAGALSRGMYTIPRYAYIDYDTKSFSFNEDIVFVKTVGYNTSQTLTNISQQKLMYQGIYTEYPKYTAAGNDNEIIFFAPGDNVIIDHFNIDVYVKKQSVGHWKKWNRSISLYLENAFAESYEVRFNENKRYEIKFGNGINGKKLEKGDEVSIFYLESNGTNGEVGPGFFGLPGSNGTELKRFSTATYEDILTDIQQNVVDEIEYLNETQIKSLTITNERASTFYSKEESVDSIRNFAPSTFRSQYRLSIDQDYETYVLTNFANLIQDVKAVNNSKYMTEQMKYYYDLGIKDPNNVSNLLYNQLYFADACNFNNVYLTAVPKSVSNTRNQTDSLTAAQKELIISTMRNIKTMTSEVIILDPVYMAVDFVLPESGIDPTIDDIDSSELVVVKDPDSRRDEESIKQDVYNVFLSYFSRDNSTLGQEIDVNYLASQVLNVEGVQTFYTSRTDVDVTYNGLAFLVWDPVYPIGGDYVVKNFQLSYFQYPYLNDRDNFVNKIRIESTITIFENVEF
jgi:hypothetical protein